MTGPGRRRSRAGRRAAGPGRPLLAAPARSAPGPRPVRPSGQLLEVLGGHRAAAGAQQQRPAELGVVEGLAVAPPTAASRFSTRATYGTLVLSTRTCPRATLPAAAAAGAVRGQPQSRRPWAGSRRSGAARRPAAATAGPNCTSPANAVEPEVPVVRAGLRRSARTGVQSLDAVVVARPAATGRLARHGHDRPALQREPLAGRAVGRPRTSSRTTSACTVAGRAADGEGRDRADLRRRGVGRLARLGARRSRQRSQPARCRAMIEAWWPARHVQHDVAGPVQPAGLVALDLAGGPAARRSTPPRPAAGRAGRRRRPATPQSSRSTTAQRRHRADSPTSSASPTCGSVGEAGEARRRRAAPVSCRPASLAGRLAPPTQANEHGTISSSRMVVKTTGSSTSVRGVATSVSAADEHRLRLRRGQPERDLAARRGRRPQLARRSARGT